ncbi:MAG: glycoside hydrolase family 3 C-terminal domain-containing protein [Planctomycetaceae bacterium]|nr:glycoside hydrolase family 3 C-terminal domain-containing protein [Planctomycetaceae bacterium]
MRKVGAAAIMALCAAGLAMAAPTEATPAYLDTSLGFEERAADLVERMTLQEKISQLGNASPVIERLGIAPYDWWNECLHGVARAGVATVFPQAIGLAASFDRAMMHDMAIVISDEARAKHHEFARNKDFGRYKGLTFWSPNINIFRDPRWGRGQETYGEDPYLTGQMGIQFVRGLQGDAPKYLKVIATAKHFAVHSGPEPDRHSFNVVVGARDLWETYLPAFRDLIVEGKAYSVMGAYNRVDGESASASWMLLQDILRNQWKFDGYVVSDCGAIDDIFKNHKIVNSAQEAAAIGVRRGCDLECGRVYQRSLLEAVQKGMIDEGEIDLALYRLVLARMKLGMFDPPALVKYAQIPYSVNNCDKHNQMALEVAQKTMTLLKNDGVLPLDKTKLRKIAVIGPNADSVVALRGNYFGEASNPVTVLTGIRNAVGKDAEVLYAEGCGLVEKKDSFAQAVEYAKQADATLFVGGLDAEIEGEEMKTEMEGFYKGDRTKIELPAAQSELLKALHATGKPVIFVLLAGSAVADVWAVENIPAILLAWYPGQRGGDAVASVLFGGYNPAGRLPVTFYASTDELGDFKEYAMAAGKGKTYRYYTGKPLYPFGHGFSYTTFEYSQMAVEGSQVRVNVKNTGGRDGQEVVQVYVRTAESDKPMPIRQLRGFERVALKAGQEKTLTFNLPYMGLRYYDPQLQDYTTQPATYLIEVGASSGDIRQASSVAWKKP